MILLGVLTQHDCTVANGSLVRSNGETEKGVLCVAGSNPFEVLAVSLGDCKLIRDKEIEIFTNDQSLLDFLKSPIRIQPTKFTYVHGWGNVGYGGDENQWQILYGVTRFNRWIVREVKRLPGTEAIHDEYRESDCYKATTGRSVQGCCRRVYEGVWASA